MTIVQTEDNGETDLDEIKQHLESTIGSEELQQKLTRALSRISVNRSESESTSDQKSTTGSLKRLLI